MLTSVYGALRRATYWLATVAGILLVAVVVITLLEVVLRNIFNQPTYWSVDVASYLLLYAIFLASPYAQLQGSHVGLDLLPVGRVLITIGNLFSIVFLTVFMHESWIVAREAYITQRVSASELAFPLFALYAVIPLGVALTLLICVIQAIFVLRRDANKAASQAERAEGIL
jgi:C4-dicarboxylate transporter, DctQ subunit